MANKERLKLWVEALRSGKYKQTLFCLHSQAGMCALGVACEVAWLNGAPVHRELIDTVRGEYDVLYDGCGGSLPLTVKKWYGLGTDNPSLARNVDVMKANDQCGWSFAQIADLLEKKYKLKEEEAPKTVYPATKIEFYLQKDKVNA